MGRPKVITNTYVVNGAVAVLTITAKKRPHIDVLIDAEDVARVQAAGPWYQGYQPRLDCCYPANGKTQLSRLVMDCPAGLQVDHKDGDTLDNRKSNMRIGTHQQNRENNNPVRSSRSGLRNVRWIKGADTWAYAIIHDGRKYRRQGFATPEEAYAAALERRRELGMWDRIA